MYRVWYSTEVLADWVINNTSLKDRAVEKKQIAESDANKPNTFHKMPTHLKNILYLDAPDLIIERDSEPVLSLEVSTEAGTGHNAFQRFARIAAAVENDVPAIYLYPEAGFVRRETSGYGWDKLNPLIFTAMENAMRLYEIPALLYYFPSHFRDTSTDFKPATKGLIYDKEFPSCPDSGDAEIIKMFNAINLIIEHFDKKPGRQGLLTERVIQERRDYMLSERYSKQREGVDSSPLTATELIPTDILLNYLKKYSGKNHDFGDLLPSRQETLVYKINAGFRGDPYPGALAALDYIKCRKGKSFEDRNYNLVMAWGDFKISENQEIILSGDDQRSVERFTAKVKETYTTPGKIILGNEFKDLEGEEIPRYFMQVRFGSTFTKVKHLRVYSYFCDAIIFPDGALWREG